MNDKYEQTMHDMYGGMYDSSAALTQDLPDVYVIVSVSRTPISCFPTADAAQHIIDQVNLQYDNKLRDATIVRYAPVPF